MAITSGGARLEDLAPGTRVIGLVPGRTVNVVQTAWHGDGAITLTYRDDDGRVAEQLLFRDDETRLAVGSETESWAFDADGRLFRLVSEALRIRLAYLFDPYLAVHTSNLEPLPHQIKAVYEELLPRQPLRFLLADDPGAGKTIMAGLFVKELIVRGDVKRCLVVAPGSLVEQWQDELWQKLGLDFEIVTRETIESSKSGNPYAEKSLVISRLDHLARNDEIQAKLAQTEWDLVIVDEAHKMSAHYFGHEVKETKRYRLGKLLGSLTRHLLLMTATPHSGKPEDFQLFMALVDPDRFEGKPRNGAGEADAQGLMRRLVKEQLLKFDGRPLFPERIATTVNYDLSEAEQRLYDEVTEYVREEMNRAERLRARGEGRRGTIVGFALTILQRRLASSPEAIYHSLARRRKRLEDRLAGEQQRRDGLPGSPVLADLDEEDIEEIDDRPEGEIEAIEEEVVDEASAAQTAEELRAEIATLERLERLAYDVRRSGSDKKWEELSRILGNEREMRDPHGLRRKLIVFTEHRDTLNYLAERIGRLVGRPEAVVTIHGGLRREERRRAQELFVQDRDVSILVATDAAGEGVNLQRAHLLVNYDLPWNPNRIEQRFGRIHRIGQTEVCHMWNLVASQTREGQVFERLFEKLKEQRKALGGQVFDVLGQVFVERSLRDLLIEAVRYGDRPDVRAKLDEVVDAAVGESLREALRERALVSDVMTFADVEAIREQMEQAEARRLQPHFIQSFFLEAFRLLGGNVSRREPGRYEITHVPAEIRSRERRVGIGLPILRRYERVTFEKQLVAPPGLPLAELVAPGHPLLDATVEFVLERHRGLLKRGATLVAEGDASEQVRALLYVEDAIQSASLDTGENRRVVSKRLQFVELERDGGARVAGYAPYLDYRPLEPGEAEVVRPFVEEQWLGADVEAAGLDYAIREAVPRHLAEVRGQTVERVTKTMAAVRERLTREIAHWDKRANELKEKELAGKKPKLNSGKARQRADELEVRLERRLAELEREKELASVPPVLVGGAAVVPAGLLDRLIGDREGPPDAFARETKRVERLAVDAVLATERRLGRVPKEMPPNNPGYDILSKDPVSGELLFVEVKGRVRGAPVFTVTKTEILTSLNKPEQFVLALVAVDEDDATEARYLREPFAGPEAAFFEVTSVNYPWDKLFARAVAPEELAQPASRWVAEMVDRIVREFEPLRIVVFGSQARGEGRDGSDADLLVVFPTLTDRRKRVIEITRLLGLPIGKDVIVASEEDVERARSLKNSVVRTATEQGRVLYERV